MNAAAMLFYRSFITVDGPLHVLHASLLEAPWSTAEKMANGITYNGGAFRPWLGHRILMILLLFFTPPQAHDIFAALVSCAVLVSVIALLRAHGTPMGPAFLWFAPPTFNILLIMGLFHFLLGIAISFCTVAWWVSNKASPRWRVIGMLAGGVLAWSAHRGAPIIFCLLFLLTLLVGALKRKEITPSNGKGISVWRITFIGIFLVFTVGAILRAAPGIPLVFNRELPDLDEMLPLRSLFLLDRDSELWPLGGIGLLLLVSICAAGWARLRSGSKVFWSDTYFALFLAFTLASWLFDIPSGRWLFITERSQWLALMFLLIWIVAMANTHHGLHTRVIVAAALGMLPLHLIRLVQAGEHFSQLRNERSQVMEASDALLPGSLVLLEMARPEKLLQNLKAYVAIDHDGILLALDEHIPLKSLSAGTGAGWLRRSNDPHWIARKWRNGIPLEVDHVMFLGNDIARRVNNHPWNILLFPRYHLSYSNDHARIYTARADTMP